jgi:class 3 adenylate cyclase
LELQTQNTQTYLSDDSVDQMLVLAERLRASNGGELDDSAIQAVAEATGAPIEYVRLAVKIKTENEKGSFFVSLKSQWLNFDVLVRRCVAAGFAAAMCAFFTAAELKADNFHWYFASEFLKIITLVWLTVGLYNQCIARDGKTAAAVGAVFAAGTLLWYDLFGVVLALRPEQAVMAIAIVPCLLGGALAGIGLQSLTFRFRGQLGLKDPASERQELLRQLTQLQDKLKSGEQVVTFLSVDIVGSTRMKESADPLSVEYTFTEYHQFVSRITRKHGGRVHSTAGDGVNCAFESPPNAFAAARNISAGLLELNTFRNKIGSPIVLRQALHTGMIMTPESGNITDVNFAHVIDIAAHMQKLAPQGGIVVSDESAKYIQGGPHSIGLERVNASGVEGTIWLPKPASLARAATPPPIPDLA